MDNKNKFNTVKIATCNDAHKAEAVNQLFERSLLFNRSDDICGIVISKNDEKQFIPISAIPDNVNIEKREGVVTLVENPVVDSITTKADHNGVDWKSQYKIAETSAERTIILLCTKNIEGATNIGVIGGEILEVGEGVYGNYKISLTPTGSGLFIGATTFEQKAALVRAKYNGTYYYGIKFKSTVPANIYFSGWDHFPDGADAPSYTSYNDADLSEIIELGGGDSGGSSGGGMTEAEKAEISAMNTQINTNKSDISALKTSVAGKSDKAHTHSAGDITSGTLPIANGGTGATTAKGAQKSLLSDIQTETAAIDDTSEFVMKYATPTDTKGAVFKRSATLVWNYIKNKISSVLGLTKDNYGGKSAKSSFLDEYVGAGGTRLTSGNIVPKDASEYGGMRKDVVTDSMTDSGRPGYDGHLLTMFWDNWGRFDSQLFISNDNPLIVKVRAKSDETDYGTWTDIITSNNIGSQTVANADRANTAGNADTVDNYHVSQLWRSDGANWIPRASVIMTPSGNNSEWSFDFINKNGTTGSYWHVWDEDKSTLLKVNADDGKVSAPYGFVGNLSGKADTADSLFYGHGNEINFKGGAPDMCYFNYRNGDTGDPSPVAIMHYAFCNYSGDTSKSVLKAGSFDGATAKASSKMVIPIGAPSSLEDGCIWIER